MSNTYIYLGLIIFAVINFLLRALPFIIFSGKELSEPVHYISEKLPAAIMIILVVYNLRTTNFSSAPYGIPEIVALIVTIILHYWKENMILTLLVGTVTYMLLLSALV